MSEKEAQDKQITEKEMARREKLRLKGIEGWLAREYPEFYAELKMEADRAGIDVPELLVRYANWAKEIKKAGSVINPEEFKKVDGYTLYIAGKIWSMLALDYFKAMAYSQLGALVQLYQMFETERAKAYQQAYMAMTGAQQQGQAQPPPGPMPPIPMPQSNLERIARAIAQGIEIFATGARRETLEEIAYRASKRALAELMAQAQQQSQGGGEGGET